MLYSFLIRAHIHVKLVFYILPASFTKSNLGRTKWDCFLLLHSSSAFTSKDRLQKTTREMILPLGYLQYFDSYPEKKPLRKAKDLRTEEMVHYLPYASVTGVPAL